MSLAENVVKKNLATLIKIYKGDMIALVPEPLAPVHKQMESKLPLTSNCFLGTLGRKTLIKLVENGNLVNQKPCFFF
jgi:hypothetical protein